MRRFDKSTKKPERPLTDIGGVIAVLVYIFVFILVFAPLIR
jgi:hypothetical protein